MPVDALSPSRTRVPAGSIDSIVVDESITPRVRVAVPHPEIHLVARFASPRRQVLDVSALGVQHAVRRKAIAAGHHAVIVRVRIGAARAVLGVPASAITDAIVSLDELWGLVAARRLADGLADCRSLRDAARFMESAIDERLHAFEAPQDDIRFVSAATELLAGMSIGNVASHLGISDRHFRREFNEAVGVSPAAYVRLARFARAVDAARRDKTLAWATIAAGAGFYDQAHLVRECKRISGVTPSALMAELASADHD